MNARLRADYALRSLRRSGQRTGLALLCISFGVLCLVAMQQLSASVRAGLLIDPRLAIGGDLVLTPPGDSLDAAARVQLRAWQVEGLVAHFSVAAEAPVMLVRAARGGRMHFLNGATGVDDAYPLLGDVVLETALDPAAPYSRTGDVLLTRDLARRLGARVGDTLVVASPDAARFAAVRLSAIADALPDRRGGRMLFTHATAAALGGTPRSARVLLGAGADAERFRAAGWRVRTPADALRENARVADLFDAMLKGAGLLGLLVGALGVLNTMQVALARRTPELATLRALGYTPAHLHALLGTELLLLGAAGAALGTAAGIALAHRLAALLGEVQGSLVMRFAVDWPLALSGFAVGLALCLGAGMIAALRAASVPPAVLLREGEVAPNATAKRAGVLLAVAWLALFAGVATLVMGSLLRGLAVVALALAGATMLLLLLGGALALLVRAPLPLGALGGMARRNLRHRPLRSLTAMAAVSIGVFSIGFAAAALLTGREELLARQGRSLGADLVISAPAAAAPAVEQALQARGLEARRDTTAADGWRWSVQAPGVASDALGDELGRALTQALVITASDIVGLLSRTVRALFTFVAAVAGLSLLAGVVLIANAIGLGLLERRRELATLRAIGYSGARVLRLVLLESALLGGLASCVGLAGTLLATAIVNARLPQAGLALPSGAAGALLLTGVALCTGTALAVAWPAARVRPLAVLRQD